MLGQSVALPFKPEMDGETSGRCEGRGGGRGRGVMLAGQVSLTVMEKYTIHHLK